MNSDKKPMSKTDVIAAMMAATGMSKQQVNEFFDELAALISKNLKEDGPGVFNVPGLMKIRVIRKPEVPERQGVNPFTKEPQVFKAKPARNIVKITPLKKLKDLV